jgi:putative peptidoglycan lipid II flippase
MEKKKLVRKTINMAISTLCSRFLGLVRTLSMAHYLGAGAMGDAFLTAFRLPNALLNIFSEGLISSVLIPTASRIIQHDGEEQANKLITLLLGITQTVILGICVMVALCADKAVWIIAPGWFLNHHESSAAIAQTIHILPILMVYIFFFVMSSFLAGALQIRNYFFVTAAQPIIINILVITELLLCAYHHAPVIVLAWLYLANSIILALISVLTYIYCSSFSWPPDESTWHYLRYVGRKLIPCFINLGIVEINTFIDTQFISFLTEGTISLFSYSASFMRVPLGMFATSFATISLPHLTRISMYAPRRLSFHAVESAKALFWLIIPTMLVMIFFSRDIFSTMLPNFSPAQSQQAGNLLIASSLGLFFFSMNRILLNIYYALHETSLPTLVSFLMVLLNIVLNVILIQHFGAVGITLSTSITGAVQTMLFVLLLKRKFHFTLYLAHFVSFVCSFMRQLACVMPLFYSIYKITLFLINKLPANLALFFIHQIGLWLWVGPLALLMMGTLWFTRNYFSIKIYYFD